MAHIQVYYRDMLKDEVELQSEVTTIGRSFDSDIKIDNAGVSAHHAKIIRQADDFIIEDIGSRNGIYVNGKRVARQSLSDGDEVVISKHILKLATSGEPAIMHEASNDDLHQVVQGATVEIDVSNLGELVRQRQSRYSAYLLLTGETQRRSKYPLTKLNFKLGKSGDSDIYTPGWFAPGTAARVVCKSDGFYLIPERRGKVRLNGMAVSSPVELKDGDGFSVRGLSLMFYKQHEDQH
jgi:hypothetical protein